MTGPIKFYLGNKAGIDLDNRIDGGDANGNGALDEGALTRTGKTQEVDKGDGTKATFFEYAINPDDAGYANLQGQLRGLLQGKYFSSYQDNPVGEAFLQKVVPAVVDIPSQFPDTYNNDVSIMMFRVDGGIAEYPLSTGPDEVPVRVDVAFAQVKEIAEKKQSADGVYTLPSGPGQISQLDLHINSITDRPSADFEKENFVPLNIAGETIVLKVQPRISRSHCNDSDSGNGDSSFSEDNGFFALQPELFPDIDLFGLKEYLPNVLGPLRLTPGQMKLFNDVLTEYHRVAPVHDTVGVASPGVFNGCIIDTEPNAAGALAHFPKIKMDPSKMLTIFTDISLLNSDPTFAYSRRGLALNKFLSSLAQEQRMVFENTFLTYKEKKEDHTRVSLNEGIFTVGGVALFAIGGALGHKLTQLEGALSTRWKVLTKGMLRAYGEDLTEQARQGKLKKITGRDAQIERAIAILFQEKNANPLFVAPPGAGKTVTAKSVVVEMAKRYPRVRFIEVSIAKVLAGTQYRGMFAERMGGIIDESALADDLLSKAKQGNQQAKGALKWWQRLTKGVMNENTGDLAGVGKPGMTLRERAAQPFTLWERIVPFGWAKEEIIIPFFDEAHTVMGAGGSREGGAESASDTLKPGMASGRNRHMAATTFAEYRRDIAPDAAMVRRYTLIEIPELTPEQMLQAVRGVAADKSKWQGEIPVTEAAISRVIILSGASESDAGIISVAEKIIDTACSIVAGRREQDRASNRAEGKRYEVTVDLIEEVGRDQLETEIRTLLADIDRKVKTLQAGDLAIVYEESVFHKQTGEASASHLRRLNRTANLLHENIAEYRSGRGNGAEIIERIQLLLATGGRDIPVTPPPLPDAPDTVDPVDAVEDPARVAPDEPAPRPPADAARPPEAPSRPAPSRPVPPPPPAPGRSAPPPPAPTRQPLTSAPRRVAAGDLPPARGRNPRASIETFEDGNTVRQVEVCGDVDPMLEADATPAPEGRAVEVDFANGGLAAKRQAKLQAEIAEAREYYGDAHADDMLKNNSRYASLNAATTADATVVDLDTQMRGTAETTGGDALVTTDGTSGNGGDGIAGPERGGSGHVPTGMKMPSLGAELGRDGAIALGMESLWHLAEVADEHYNLGWDVKGKAETWRMPVDMSAIYFGGKALSAAGLMAHSPTVAGLAEGFLPMVPGGLVGGAITNYGVSSAAEWAKTSDNAAVHYLGETFSAGTFANKATTGVGGAVGGGLPMYLAARSPVWGPRLAAANPYLGTLGGAILAYPKVGEAIDATCNLIGVDSNFTGRTGVQGTVSAGVGYIANKALTQGVSAVSRYVVTNGSRLLVQAGLRAAATEGAAALVAGTAAEGAAVAGTAALATEGVAVAGGAVVAAEGGAAVVAGGAAAVTAPAWATVAVGAAAVVAVAAVGYVGYRYATTDDAELDAQLGNESKQDDMWGRFLQADGFIDGIHDAVMGNEEESPTEVPAYDQAVAAQRALIGTQASAPQLF